MAGCQSKSWHHCLKGNHPPLPPHNNWNQGALVGEYRSKFNFKKEEKYKKATNRQKGKQSNRAKNRKSNQKSTKKLKKTKQKKKTKKQKNDFLYIFV